MVEIALLRSLPMMAPLAPPVLEDLARRLVSIDVPAGRDVVRVGEPGERFYVVADGELDVDCGEVAVPSLARADGCELVEALDPERVRYTDDLERA